MSSLNYTLCSDDIAQQNKRKLTVERVQKWIKEGDKEFGISAWLKYEKVDPEHVATLKCSVCVEFNNKLLGMRNYNFTFFVGTKNLLLSSYMYMYKDNTVTDIHKRAMYLFKKQHRSDITDYEPIAKALHTLDTNTEAKVKCTLTNQETQQQTIVLV